MILRLTALCPLLLLAFFTNQGQSSLCVVTKFGPWSECTGNCQYALQVRNRDVLRPPFPEFDQKTGEKFIRPCPVLYETRECQPTECLSKERIEATTTTQKPHIAAAMNEFFRDLPIIRSVTSDTAKSPFESEKVISRSNWKKVVEKPVDYHRNPVPLRRVIQSHRPNCTLEMNPQCCRIVRDKDECPDRSQPKKLIRWFRLPGEQLCRQFHYSHCGEAIERQDKPLVTESSCLQLCFSEYEKAVLPSLRII